MTRAIFLLAACATACVASARSKVDDGPALPARTGDSLATVRANVDLSGTWATGSAGEPTARRLELRPPCNYGPPLWILEQRGDTVRAWSIPESHDQGVPSTRVVSKVPAEGRVSGWDVFFVTGARYVLRYDSTSGHLRGTLNGATFWAVRQDVIRPTGCIPPP